MPTKPTHSELRVGLIGMGRHGSRYARHLLEGIRGCRLAGISRRDTSAGETFARDNGVLFFEDWKELLVQSTIDAVVVVTPPELNHEISLAAVQAGKAMLIEKPLSVTAPDARAMVKAARDAGVPIMTAHTLRFAPVIQVLRDQLSVIGSLQYLSLAMRVDHPVRPGVENPGAGVFLDLGVHLMDLIRYLTGEEANQVSATNSRRVTDRMVDAVHATFVLSSGMRCYVEASRGSGARVCRVEAIGSIGALIADVNGSTLTHIKGRMMSESNTVPDRPTIISVLEDFSRCLATKSPMPVSGEDGLRAVIMAEASSRAALLNEGVPIPTS